MITGRRFPDGRAVVMFGNVQLDPGPSQQLYNHSPTGFEWGYGGSGPAQLALAILFQVTDDGSPFPRVSWVVAGGESGPHVRPMHPDWARSLRNQCQITGVPFFMKQMARKQPIPDDLMIREWPQCPRPSIGGIEHQE